MKVRGKGPAGRRRELGPVVSDSTEPLYLGS